MAKAMFTSFIVVHPSHEVIDYVICVVETPDHSTDFLVLVVRISTAGSNEGNLLLPVFLYLLLHMR